MRWLCLLPLCAACSPTVDTGATLDFLDGGAAIVDDMTRARPRDLAQSSSPDLSQQQQPMSQTDLVYCVTLTNQYRAMVSKPALTESGALEQFAAAGAMNDGTLHMPHNHFISTNGGNGIAFAENEIPWWPLSSFGSVHDIITQGLAQMWAEGPGGGHYDNMTGGYTELGCGIYVNGDEVTVTQDYR